MARTFTCLGCRRVLPANPRCKNQEYCGSAACQRMRKRRWQARKMDTDADYRENQREAYKAWCKANPDYWRKRRRVKTNAKAAASEPPKNGPVEGGRKMDTFGKDLFANSGEYLLVRTDVKMDALRVKIIAISPS